MCQISVNQIMFVCVFLFHSKTYISGVFFLLHVVIIYFFFKEASLVQDNDNPKQRSKTTSPYTEKRTATGKSSGLLSFSKNIGTKASIVAFCILFILLVIAHILLSLVQRIKENSDIILV